MTGAFVTDMCDASGSLLLDVARRQWSARILDACGIRERQLPRLLEGNQVSGALLPHIAREWGLEPGLPIAAGAGDAAAGATGIGAVNDGDAFVSLGTSAQYFVARTEYRPEPCSLVHAFCHA